MFAMTEIIPIIFRIQQNVDADDSHTDGHHHQNQVDEKNETVHIVKLVVPERRKDVVHLNENGTERENTRGHNDEPRL
jgi:hypothetical protein